MKHQMLRRFVDLTIQENKWFLSFSYRPESIDRKLFFDEFNKSLLLATNNYNNFIVAGDLNIEINPEAFEASVPATFSPVAFDDFRLQSPTEDRSLATDGER